MKGFIAGLILGLLLCPIAIYLYFSLGFAPVATDSPPMPFENFLAATALDARVEHEMPTGPSPVRPTDDNLTAGANVYSKSCGGCHGKIDQKPGPFAQALFPKPPYLLDPDRRIEDPPEAYYWVITNGIRLSAMPAFKNMLTDDQRWQLSEMLVNAHKLPATAQALLK